jgi:hypothetical protein
MMRKRHALTLIVASLAVVASLGVGGLQPLPARAVGVSGGVTLDGYGGLRAFGSYRLDTSGAPTWLNWDIARALTVMADGSGGWTLDGFGGIHAFGNTGAVISPGYWQGWDIARSMVLTSKDANGMPDGRQGYLLDGFGGVRPWGRSAVIVGCTVYPG